MYATFRSEPSLFHGEASITGGASSASWLDVTLGALHLSAFADHAVLDEDVVSEHDLITHLHATPAVAVFLAAQPASLAAGATITGAAFSEAAGASIHNSGDLVLTFIDERFAGLSTAAQPAGSAPLTFPAESDATFILADKTVIHLTGLVRDVSRAVTSSFRIQPAFSYAT